MCVITTRWYCSQNLCLARVTGRYPGCYVRITGPGESSGRTLASDADLHTCSAGTRGFILCAHWCPPGIND